jgi:Methyltransferase domain
VTWNNETIRALEQNTIRNFLLHASARDHFVGRVLDFGCGRQPYRDIVEKGGGEYHGFDHPDFPGSTVFEEVGDWQPTPWDTILCTQVLQYVADPREVLFNFHEWLNDTGRLVLTFATSWDEVEPDDKWRFTATGMERLLHDVGFADTYIAARGVINLGGFRFYLGHGAIAWK